MAAKTERVDSGAMFDRLDALRLANDWSFRQLSADMARVGVTVSAQTLHQLLTDRPARPYERTLYKISKYFEQLDAATVARPRKRASA